LQRPKGDVSSSSDRWTLPDLDAQGQNLVIEIGFLALMAAAAAAAAALFDVIEMTP
jgi:hypothetical protein